MALGSNVSAGFDATPVRGNITISADIRTKWVAIIDAGGLEVQDDTPIVNPTTEITGSTTHIFVTGGRGSTLYLRMRYDDGLTSITDPVVMVFGRHSSADTQWMLLLSAASTPATTEVLPTDLTNDVRDGTDHWTAVSDATKWPLLGCDEILVGVLTALAATGDATLSTLEAKVV